MTIKNGEFAEATEVVESIGRLTAQQAYERVKDTPSSVLNVDYLGADVFTSDGGEKGTVDTGESTAVYDSGNDYYVLGFTDEAGDDTTDEDGNWSNPENAFDNDDSTYASDERGVNEEFTAYLGKTFSSKYISYIKIKATASNEEGATCEIRLQTYDGSSWNTIETLASDNTGYVGDPKSASYNNYYNFDGTTQGIRIAFVLENSTDTGKARLYTLEYGNYDSSSNVQTNTIIDEKTPKSILVYAEKDIPDDTEITIDVSQDGGSSWDITGEDFDTYIDTISFTGSDLALRFNLSTEDTEVTPKLYGYSVVITDK